MLGNDTVKTFQRQQRIGDGVVFYAVRVVSKESKRLVLPRIYCLNKYTTLTISAFTMTTTSTTYR
jgi:hypothetical protein